MDAPRVKFFEALKSKDRDLIKKFFDSDFDPNTISRYGFHPLTLPVLLNDAEMLKILLENEKVDRNPKHEGKTPLGLGMLYVDKLGYDRKLFELLIADPQTDINSPSIGSLSPLSYAIHNNNGFVRDIISSPRFDSTVLHGEDQRTYLELAAEKGDAKLVRTFLEYGFDPNRLDSKRWSPLNLAIDRSHTDVAIAILDDKRTNVDLRINSWTPSMMAAAKGNKEVLVKLRERNANPDLLNDDGYSAVDIAKQYRHPDLAEFLNSPLTEILNKGAKQVVSQQCEEQNSL